MRVVSSFGEIKKTPSLSTRGLGVANFMGHPKYTGRLMSS